MKVRPLFMLSFCEFSTALLCCDFHSVSRGSVVDRIYAKFEMDNLVTSINMLRDAYCTLLFRKENKKVQQLCSMGEGIFSCFKMKYSISL